ncbi:hypothetical protein Tco_1128157 [Tanacetum coccineum]
MSNTNNNLQTQTSNALHNAIMEVGGKDRPPMLAPESTLQILMDCEDCSSYRRSQQAASRNKGKAIVTSSTPTYDQEPAMVVDDDEMSKEKEIDKLMALISLSFKKIYKPTNKNLRTSSNTSRANQDNTLRINKGTGYDNKRVVNVARARENVADWRDDTDDEPDDQELEAHYMYMAQIQEITPNVVDNFGPIFDTEPLQKEKGDTNITIDSLDMCTNGETVDQDDDDLARERDLLASLIDKLKCEINDNKNCNKLLELSNKTLVDKLEGEIEDFKTKNKSLESSNNHFKEANNELSKTNQLMFKDLKKFQAELDRYHDVNYALKVEVDCAKAKGDLAEYYYADHMNAILGVYTTLYEFTDLQCDYVDQVVKCERLEKELSKRVDKVNNKSFNELSKRFSEPEQHSINLELALQQSQEQLNNDKVWK